jgi:outer membrane protein insertion porin family
MKIIKPLLIFYLLISSTLADQIDKIVIFGNQRISESTIKVLSNLSIDQNYTSEDLNLSFKKLYDTNFFKDIKFEIIDQTLNIFVEENPIIEDIQIEGLKNNNLEKFIFEKMVLKNRMSFTNILLQRDINLIENILKTNGYYFSKITTSISENKKVNSIQIKLEIDKGERAKIKKISFIGNKIIKDKKLLEIIASEEHKFWKFISNKVYINEETINLDKRLLENFYKNLGYFKVKVLDSFAQFNNDLGNFELVYNINAGDKFFFNEFSLNLPDDYNKKDFNKVIRIFEELKGENYSLDGISLILNQIDTVASSRLYDFIDANVEENIIDQNKINFTFNIKDSKKAYVEKINIKGNNTTIEEVIRNRFIVDEGDPLNTLLYNKSINNIRSLGIFKNVRSEVKDGSDDLNRVLDIIVEEQPTGEISLAAGVGTSGSTLGGGIREKNFLGKGIDLATNLEISEDGIKGQFKYSKPNFAYTDNTLFTSVQSTTSDLLSDFGYKQSDINFSIGTSFEQYENLYFSPEFDISFEDLKTTSNASESLKKQEGSYNGFIF